MTNIKPLCDGTYTPRGAKRATSLERTFDGHAWMYNRNAMDSFDGPSIANDKKRGKVLKAIIKKKKKGMASMRHSSCSYMNSSKEMTGISNRLGAS